MHVTAIEIRDTADDLIEISGQVSCTASHIPPLTCWYRLPRSAAHLLGNPGDLFLASLLLPAMVLREALHIEAPLSPGLLDKTPAIQDIYRNWVAGAAPVEITGSGPFVAPPRAPTGQVACFFSGGVDSFYSFLKHRDAITHLLLISGFDSGLKNPQILEKTRSTLHQVAAQSGKQLLEIRTNIRDLGNRIVGWGFLHGAILGGVAILLSGGMDRVIVPSSYAYGQLFPWGSHPLLDPLWSTNGMTVVHDGCEASRLEKTACISRSPLALASLRVCWDSTGDNNYNCGKCEKCLRTMLSLYAFGALERCRTFPSAIDPRRLRKIRLKTYGQIEFARENLDALAKLTDRHGIELHSAMRAVMRRARIRRAFRILLGKE